MKLVTVPSSPFGRKVEVTAAEHGLLDRIDIAYDNPWNPDTRVTDLNPAGKVPVLLSDEGLLLYGSSLICEFLTDLGRGPHRFYPARGAARWLALRRQELADQATDAFVAVRLERNRPLGEQSPGWIGRKLAVLGRCLNALEAEEFETADAPTIGHIAAAVLLGHLDFRRTPSDGDWRSGHPRLSVWYDAFEQRPSMVATRPHD